MKYHIMFTHRVYVLHLWISIWTISTSISPSFSAWTRWSGHQFDFRLTSFFWKRHLERCWTSVWRNSFHQFCDQLPFCQHQRFRSHRRGVIKWPNIIEHREMAASATVNIKEYKSTQIPDNIVLSQQYHHGLLNQVAIKDLQDQGYLFVYPVKSIITWSTTSVPLAILPMSQTSRRRWRISTEVWDSRGSILAYISLYPCGWWRKAASGRTTSMNPTGVIWNYHVPVTIDRAMKDDRTEHLMKIGHAGLHLLCSSRPLEAAVKQGHHRRLPGIWRLPSRVHRPSRGRGSEDILSTTSTWKRCWSTSGTVIDPARKNIPLFHLIILMNLWMRSKRPSETQI